MKKAVVTVISGRRLANASLLMDSVEKHLKGWDSIVFVLDLSQDELNGIDSELMRHASYRPAEELIGEEYMHDAFFLSEKELAEYIKVTAILELFDEYDEIVLCDCASAFYNHPDFMEIALNEVDAVFRTKIRYFDEKNEIPDSFLLLSDCNRVQSQLFGLSKGTTTLKYIEWCASKFSSLMSNSVTTDLNDNFQHEFIFSWQMYSPVFDLKDTEAPENQYMVLRDQHLIPKSIQSSVFINFSNLDSKKDYEESADTIVKKYFDEISRLQDIYGIKKTYKYDFFSDGTQINELLRSYYFENYRLRDKCRNNPFDCRELFTDISIITGDESSLPITAMADCIWRHRPDLQECFPLYCDNDRAEYVAWFLNSAPVEYKLSKEYTSVISEKFAEYIQKELLQKSKDNKFVAKVLRKIHSQHHTSKLTKDIDQINKRYPAGINLCGFIKGEFGLGEATRILARTLDAGDVPFSIIDYRVQGIHLFTNHEWDSKITNEFKYNTNIILITVAGTPDFLKTISKKAVDSRYNIGFLYWELPEFPDQLANAFEYFDEIWVASNFTAEAFIKHTSLPVFCLPCCVTAECNGALDRKYFGLPENRFMFLMMYDTRSNPERKNPLAVVRAFVQAFDQRDDVALVIKINSINNIEAEDELIASIRNRPNIILILGTFDKVEVNSLINNCDAFISLHRSEGFGLGPAEAMYLGKPAILTNWSGNKEYMTDDNCCPVDYKVIEIDKDYGPYKKGNHWAEPSVDHAAMYMKKLVEDKDYYCEIAENGRNTIKEKFSPQAICDIAIARLHELKLY